MYSVSDGVEINGNEAFKRCTNLTLLVIPGSVKSIGYKTFRDCHAIETVKLTGKVNADNLKMILNVLPSSVKTLDLSECEITKNVSRGDIEGLINNSELKSVKVKFPEPMVNDVNSEAAGGGAPSTSSTVCRAASNAEVNAGPPPGHSSCIQL